MKNMASISVMVLAVTYIEGFIVAQVPYFEDFGIIPYNQIDYIYFGFFPMLLSIVLFILLLFFIMEKRNHDKLKHMPYSVLIILVVGFVLSLIITKDYSNIVVRHSILLLFEIAIALFFAWEAIVYYFQASVVSEDLDALNIRTTKHFEALEAIREQMKQTPIEMYNTYERFITMNDRLIKMNEEINDCFKEIDKQREYYNYKIWLSALIMVIYLTSYSVFITKDIASLFEVYSKKKATISVIQLSTNNFINIEGEETQSIKARVIHTCSDFVYCYVITDDKKSIPYIIIKDQIRSISSESSS